MKTKLLFTKTLLVLSLYSVNAQVIPNYNFETWSNGANSAPDRWQDHGSNQAGFYPASQSTDHFLGSYSAHIENKITATDTTKGVLETIRPGQTVEGLRPAFAVSTLYTTLTGFYKFTPQNGDSAVILAMFFKTGYVNPQGYGNVITGAWKTIGAAAAVWTPFSTTTIMYPPSIVPDSAWISLYAYQEMNFSTGIKYPNPVKGNSVLYVDALNYDSFLSDINEHLDITKDFKLYPNQNCGVFDVNFETSESGYTTIKIYDMEGKEAMNLLSENLNSGNHTFHFDLESLDNGNYLFVVATAEGYRAEKICIQK